MENIKDLMIKHEQMAQVLSNIRFYEGQVETSKINVDRYSKNPYWLPYDSAVHGLEIHEKCLARWKQRYNRMLNELKEL